MVREREEIDRVCGEVFTLLSWLVSYMSLSLCSEYFASLDMWNDVDGFSFEDVNNDGCGGCGGTDDDAAMLPLSSGEVVLLSFPCGFRTCDNLNLESEYFDGGDVISNDGDSDDG